MTNPRWRPSAFIITSIALHGLAIVTLIASPSHWPWMLGLVLANQALLTGLGLWPRSRWLGPNITCLPDAVAAKRQMALSIDDGPDPVVTPQVLDILDQYQVRATFFCVGEKAARHAELCREIVRRGHHIENHTQCHSHCFAFSGLAGFRREIQAAQDTLTRIAGRAPRFFRAPAGLRNPLLDPVLAVLNLHLVAWTRRGYDTRSGDATAISRRLLPYVIPGAILLLHDGNCARTPAGRSVILEVLPKVLDAARAAGLTLVTLDEALPQVST